MPHAAALDRAPDAPGAATALLRRRVLVEDDLPRLVTLFADALAEEGVTGHFCLSRSTGPVLGDRPDLIEAARFAPELAMGVCAPVAAVHVNGVAGAIDLVLVAGPDSPLPRAAVARVRGFATLYAARASLLRAGGAATPLTALQRYTMGRLLAGDPLTTIAYTTDLAPETIREAADLAVAALAARDLTDAIAIAARKGWLLNIVNEFSTLSLNESTYIPPCDRIVGRGEYRCAASGNGGESRALQG